MRFAHKLIFVDFSSFRPKVESGLDGVGYMYGVPVQHRYPLETHRLQARCICIGGPVARIARSAAFRFGVKTAFLLCNEANVLHWNVGSHRPICSANTPTSERLAASTHIWGRRVASPRRCVQFRPH
jgi:hypothetical protein